ncbi:CBS domain-containing protein [Stenotrophomonas indicatrix]|uniref:CBS domain-containing protein n=1 Tax=Stenotrophomonas indicatrix TaxID=2045451 RepID=UPI0028F10BB8|nr:CBS domain-containing protein [Stenotrophomonas indicatrix]MDT9580599.1 CBS domain-containing protein [Stenotrophomonas indicatrix]
MSSLDDRLAAITVELNKGVTAPSDTVRTILSWLGAERRGTWVVKQINSALEANGLVTTPSFESTWLDGTVTFGLKPSVAAGETQLDPTFRLGRLEAANKPVISVAPNDSLAKAVTLMLTYDFSQLPVMVGARDVKGTVSWKTIGARLAMDRSCQECQEFMETAQIVSENVSLLEAVDVIAKHDYVLVQRVDKTIAGLVTASDFSSQFRLMSEPFLLVGEIENGIRHLLHGRFSAGELQGARADGDTTRVIERPSDLTFGEYVRLLQDESNWTKLGVKMDRREFVKQLDRVRGIRNDVMHFDPDGLDPDDKAFLVEFAQFLKRVREICR